MSKGNRRGAAAHILVVLSVLLCLGLLSAPVSKVGADDSAEYTAAEIEDWLISQVESSVVTLDSGPTVVLNSGDHLMTVRVGFKARGITAELDPVEFTFNGTTSVSVAGRVSVFGKKPLFECNAEIECAAYGVPQVTNISNVEIAGHTPSLSSGDLDTIADTINKAIEASGLQVGSLGGDLTGIDVVLDDVTPKLELTWSGGSVQYDAAAIQSKLTDAANILVDQANDYLSTGYGDPDGKWWLRVSIGSDTGPLTFEAQATVFGITAKIEDMDITFAGNLTASFTGAKVSVGTSTKELTFSAGANISCTNYVPSLTVTSLSVGNEYPSLRDYIADSGVNSALRDALGDLVDYLVTDTGLTVGLATFHHIDVVDSKLKIWREPGIDISGVTTCICCHILPGVTLDLYQDTTLLDSDVSDGAGTYTVTAPEAGTYTVTASKTDFRDRVQTVVVAADPVTLNFRADTGLLGKCCTMSTALEACNHWIYPVPPCGLKMSTVLAAINAWIYPLP